MYCYFPFPNVVFSDLIRYLFKLISNLYCICLPCYPVIFILLYKMKIGKKTRSNLCSAILFLISMKVCLVMGLNCIQCHTRLHKGCTNLDYTVRHQECVGDEVCAKFSTWHMKRGPNGVLIPYGKGTIRDCLVPDPDGLNTCMSIGNEMEPGEKCFCNSTDFCNGSPGGRHQYNSSISDNWKLILLSFLIYHCVQFAFS